MDFGFSIIYFGGDVGKIHEIPRSVRCKIERKKNALKKTITQDNIYVVWQFVYVHKVERIFLLSWKNIRCGSIVFFLKTIPPNPDLQTTIFLSCV